MTRRDKIKLLQAIASGEAPAEAINGPKMRPIIFQTEKGKYPIGDRILSEAEFRQYCADIERANKWFPDFQTGPPIVFCLDERFEPIRE
jgi:hypothetical protein